MIPGLLAVLLAGAVSAPNVMLERAQAAFARAEYETAESLALSSAQAPNNGAALYLVGLARFRAGHLEEALTALDEAGQASDAPAEGPWRYNRAACLYELGRFAEAEAEYVRAADLDHSLYVVSLVNAGFAALDGGHKARAWELAQRARSGASGEALEVVADLERQIRGQVPAISEEALAVYRKGLAAYDAGRYAEARDLFRLAAASEPKDARSRIMWGASALKLEARDEARQALETALDLAGDPTEAEMARDYLVQLSNGLIARGRGLELDVRLGGGIDTNYLQSGPVDFTSTSNDTGMVGLATASVTAGWKLRPLPNLFAEISYGADQLAYVTYIAADYSVQQHLLTGVLEYSIQRWLRVGVSGLGLLDFVGLSGFRLLEYGGGAGAWLALDELDLTTTRLGIDWTANGTSGSEFAYLAGQRTDVSLSQSLRLGLTTTALEYRFRNEALGTLAQSVTMALPPLICEECTQNFIIPFGYLSHTLTLSFGVTLATILRLGASAGLEWRTYAADSFLQLTAADGSTTDLDRRRRVDLRFFAGAVASIRVLPALDVSLRYDVVANQSNIDDSILEGRGSTCGPPNFDCHQFDYDNKNYTKHTLLLETGYSW